MTQLSPDLLDQMRHCLSLAQTIETHHAANQVFEELRSSLAAENPIAAQLLELAWRDVIAARRSACFWQQMSDAEKEMADKIMGDLTQMKRDNLRLIQEM